MFLCCMSTAVHVFISNTEDMCWFFFKIPNMKFALLLITETRGKITGSADQGLLVTLQGIFSPLNLIT